MSWLVNRTCLSCWLDDSYARALLEHAFPHVFIGFATAYNDDI